MKTIYIELTISPEEKLQLIVSYDINKQSNEMIWNFTSALPSPTNEEKSFIVKPGIFITSYSLNYFNFDFVKKRIFQCFRENK